MACPIDKLPIMKGCWRAYIDYMIKIINPLVIQQYLKTFVFQSFVFEPWDQGKKIFYNFWN